MTGSLMMDTSLVIRLAAVVKINNCQTSVHGPRLLREKVVTSLWQNQKNRDNNKMFIKLFLCV